MGPNNTEISDSYADFASEDGILVVPTVADPPLKLKTKKGLSAEFHDCIFMLSSIASMSGCCQVTIPLGNHNDCPISVSFITFHGADKFLLDTVLDMYSTLQEQARIAPNSVHLPDTNGNMDASELLKEKGNASFKGKQWNKAVNYYTEAIKLNATNATYYCNRAAAYLELGCFQQAEEDCSKAILLDKKVSGQVCYTEWRCFMCGLNVDLGVPVEEVGGISVFVGIFCCKVGCLPMNYLGIPLGSSYKVKAVWNPFIEKWSGRYLGWKKLYLSKGGRLTLIKCPLSILGSYYLSLFPIPTHVASKFEKLQWNFLWGWIRDEFKFHLV
uniref:Uncharacterized protein n=1 Tax=Fagus sylvatica TaxID=28930 RepID=A0A2N9FIC5_FAGSY